MLSGGPLLGESEGLSQCHWSSAATGNLEIGTPEEGLPLSGYFHLTGEPLSQSL